MREKTPTYELSTSKSKHNLLSTSNFNIIEITAKPSNMLSSTYFGLQTGYWQPKNIKFWCFILPNRKKIALLILQNRKIICVICLCKISSRACYLDDESSLLFLRSAKIIILKTRLHFKQDPVQLSDWLNFKI